MLARNQRLRFQFRGILGWAKADALDLTEQEFSFLRVPRRGPLGLELSQFALATLASADFTDLACRHRSFPVLVLILVSAIGDSVSRRVSDGVIGRPGG